MALHRIAVFVLALTVLAPVTASAQTSTPTPAASTSTDQLLKPGELDALVAPIALYPDTLLSLVLMASTYPLEVIQADRWLKEHKKLEGNELKAAADKESWDESVKSLVATPDVLSMMSAKQGYRVGGGRTPFHGYYYFKILTRQGPAAPGGEADYVVNGKMIGGFALVAYPAEYRNSGVMTFIVNHAGTVFQKDLGPNTAQLAERMTSFNPDKSWQAVTDTEPLR